MAASSMHTWEGKALSAYIFAAISVVIVVLILGGFQHRIDRAQHQIDTLTSQVTRIQYEQCVAANQALKAYVAQWHPANGVVYQNC